MSEPRPCAYDEYYYAHDCGRPYQRDEHWLGFFGGIADRIVRDIAPRTVLDAGCAMGFLVEALRDRGVEAFGLDISPYAIERVRDDVLPYCRVTSITEPLSQRYDLIVCIEVLEHLSPREAELAVANLCAHTDDVLFSSTPVDYREATHVNVQPPEQWAELFARQGLFHDLDYDAGYITNWATRFRRWGEPVTRLVRHYERRLWSLQTENAEVRLFTGQCRAEMAALEQVSGELRQKLLAGEAALSADADHRVEQAIANGEEALRAARMETEQAIANGEEALRAARMETEQAIANGEEALRAARMETEQAVADREEALRAADARMARVLQSRSWRLTQAMQQLWGVLTLRSRRGGE
jgi:SAM-dependent methyltransferase